MSRDGRDAAGDAKPASWRSRVVLPVVVAVCAAVTGIAITGASHDSPGLRFVQAGHWIYNSALGRAFHIDGGARDVDAEVRVPGGMGSATVVQTDRRGYVLSRGTIVEFGKSDLAVADSVDAPAEERPVGLEAPEGSAFAVYQEAGKVVRFGENPVTESAGGPIDSPVVTDSGTLWVHRTDGGQVCRLPAEASRMTCTATTPAGHAGGLTLVDQRPMWVDTTADTMRPVSEDGLGRATPLRVDLPDSSVIAANDLEGQVAAVDPSRSVLHLVDAASTLAGKTAEPPVAVELDAGEYGQIASTGTTVAVLDESAGEMVTLDAAGRQLASANVPGTSTGDRDEEAEPTLFRAADSQLYVDSVTGEHVMVIEDSGEVTRMRVDPKPSDDRPERRSPTPSPSREQRDKPDREQRTTPPPDTDEPDRDDSEEHTREPDPPEPKKEPAPPPSRPGAPTNVRGVVGDSRITVKWGAAAGNGSKVRSYQLTWSGGNRTVPGGARTASIPGLTNGSSYAVTVRAVNRGGTGPGGVTDQLVPYGPADPPGDFWVERLDEEEHMFHWNHPDLNGGELLGYRITRDHGEKVKEQDADQDYQDWGGLIEGKDYHFTVRAITRSPEGETLTGKVASLNVTPGESGEGQ